jgi:hypothetical protein
MFFTSRSRISYSSSSGADAVEMGLPASIAVAARVVRFSSRPPSSD